MTSYVASAVNASRLAAAAIEVAECSEACAFLLDRLLLGDTPGEDRPFQGGVAVDLRDPNGDEGVLRCGSSSDRP